MIPLRKPGGKLDPVRDLVEEVFLAVDMLLVDPQVGRAVGGQHHLQFLGRRAVNFAVGPGAQVMRQVIKRRNIHKMIVFGAEVAPLALKIADLACGFFRPVSFSGRLRPGNNAGRSAASTPLR